MQIQKASYYSISNRYAKFLKTNITMGEGTESELVGENSALHF